MLNAPRNKTAVICLVILTAVVLLSGCERASSAGTPNNGNEKLKVVATTTILGNVVGQVGGEAIELTVLLPAGTDPHTFEPAPRDLAAIAQADLIFINGAGLEAFLNDILDSAREEARFVSTSDGIDLLQFEEAHKDNGDEEHADGEVDPHVWFDPNNVVIWTQNIEQALSEYDPDNAAIYKANAEAYQDQLQELDGWIQDQVTLVPEENRKLVTDHQVFGYFADRYGFEQIGAVIPSFSAGAEPSAQQIAKLEDKIGQFDIPAIFVGTSVNPDLAERIASDTGVQLVRVYTGSLSEPGGDAGSYIALMRYDTSAIVSALKE